MKVALRPDPSFEYGSATLELVVLLPVVVLLVAIAYTWGRYEITRDVVLSNAWSDAGVFADTGQLSSTGYSTGSEGVSPLDELCSRGPAIQTFVTNVPGTSGNGKSGSVQINCTLSGDPFGIPGVFSPNSISIRESVPIDHYRSLP